MSDKVKIELFREEFESHANKIGLNNIDHHFTDDQSYASERTQNAWDIWKAAIKAGSASSVRSINSVCADNALTENIRDAIKGHMQKLDIKGWMRRHLETDSDMDVEADVENELPQPAEQSRAGTAEQVPFAYFQFNRGWNRWEEVITSASGEDGVVAAYRATVAPPVSDMSPQSTHDDNVSINRGNIDISTDIDKGSDHPNTIKPTRHHDECR